MAKFNIGLFCGPVQNDITFQTLVTSLVKYELHFGVQSRAEAAAE